MECQLDNQTFVASDESMETLNQREKDLTFEQRNERTDDAIDVNQLDKNDSSYERALVTVQIPSLQNIEQYEDEDVSDEEEPDQTTNPARDEEYVFPTPEELNKACPPSLGMVFSTLEEAVRFVNVYGQIVGFSVIKGRNYKGRKISLNCNKGRKTISSVVGPRKRRRRTIDRTGCGMNVTVKLLDGKWHIISLNMEHNHELVSSPSLTKFFLSHQHMNEEEIMLSQLLQEIRVKPRGIMTIFRKLRGSFGNIMFSTKKLDNLKQG